MRVEYVAPFIEASLGVVQTITGSPATRGQLSARPMVCTSHQVNVACGVTGDIEGQVIYGMSVIAADRIASMMCASPISTFDQMAASAIAEFANRISEESARLLRASGYRIDISPPTIVKGTNVRITSVDMPAIVVPVSIQTVGHIEISVSLQERRELAA